MARTRGGHGGCSQVQFNFSLPKRLEAVLNSQESWPELEEAMEAALR
jgi:hypothetical protein